MALSTRLTGAGSLYGSVTVLPEVGSTNAWLAERARAGAPEGTVVTTDHQVFGRGRLDRTWVTPWAAAVAVSVLLRPSVAVPRWPWLPLLTGLAVAEGVEATAGVRCGVKWPNDVLVGERKVAGILLERVEPVAGGSAAAVVGVGLNVSTRREELPVPSATSLALEGARTSDRATVLVGVLDRLAERYRAWTAADGDPVRGLSKDYRERCVTLGREVRVDLPAAPPVVGRAVDVDEHGRLCVESGGTVRALGAGDVVHVRPTAP